jgi:ribosomal protein S18 acetylase RimI-like enzyme
VSIRAADLTKDMPCIQSLLENIDLTHVPLPEEIKNVNHQWFVFEQDGVICDCVVAKKDRCEIGHVVVHPNCRRKGIGSKLVRTSVTFLQGTSDKQIWAQVRITNGKSIGLFKKNGFVEEKIWVSPENPKVKLHKLILPK